MNRFVTGVSLPLLLLLPALALGLPTLSERVAGLQAFEGFFDLYWDPDEGRMLLHVDRVGVEFIYQSSMPRGVGSNDLGLDRGQLGPNRLVVFDRHGPRLLLRELNTAYRTAAENREERRAVESSFATSVLWGFDIEVADGDAVLVDATDFFLRDAHGLAETLSRAQQGDYAPEPSRSAIFLPRTKSFPDNTEIEAVVTFTGQRKFDAEGRPASDILPTVVPDPSAITVHFHHSFVRLPDDGYESLPLDPRAGMIPGATFLDYSSAVGDPLRTTWARRHRLEKQDPAVEFGEAVEPIVYYVDPGTPEPIRSALIEGASWWNDAFEAAGYRNAFQVRLLPEGADPMDMRYNVIQWVHRSTRGWSYGYSVLDPRTGEILKGHVTLGSLRVRQDYLIAEGLLAPYEGEEFDDRMLEMALARIRQLSAHEVGHTLGIAHNFAASVNDRSSVMDYPFPLIRFGADGELDLSEAYGVGVGEWDRRTVDYAYRDFAPGVDADSARRAILERTIADGLLYVADGDSRDPGSAHPAGNLWDNGADALAEFGHLLVVRELALGRFGEANIRRGRPLALQEEALVPLYLLHRYQIQAVGKLIGGYDFRYGLRGDGQEPPRPVPAPRQWDAIDALVTALEPGRLVLPEGLAETIPPRPPEVPMDRESFARETGVTFDALAPAASAVGLTLDVLLNAERAARMNRQHAGDDAYPAFAAVLESLLDVGWRQDRLPGVEGAIQRVTGLQVLYGVMRLAGNADLPGDVRAAAAAATRELGNWLERQRSARVEAEWVAHYDFAAAELERWRQDPERFPPPPPAPAPPGSPIGAGWQGH